jgi:predicted nucleotidyltransferase
VVEVVEFPWDDGCDVDVVVVPDPPRLVVEVEEFEGPLVVVVVDPLPPVATVEVVEEDWAGSVVEVDVGATEVVDGAVIGVTTGT